MDQMILTAGKFEQIMATLKSEGAGSREKRDKPRVGMRMQARILIHSQGGNARSEYVWLRDLSSEGIGFTHATPVVVGAILIVCLPRGSAGSMKLLYRVARCTSVDKEQYIIGAKLDRVLEDAGGIPPAPAPSAEVPPPAAATPEPPAAAA